MRDWNDVVSFALTLPAVVEGTTYGKPAVKLNGKMLAATTAPDAGSFVLHVTVDEKAMLIETDPDTFWETDHYRDWAAVLVRYGTDAHERIVTYIERAWWDRAKKSQREVWGERP